MGQRVYQDFAHELNLNTVGDMEEHRCDKKMNLSFDESWYKHVAMENYKNAHKKYKNVFVHVHVQD